MIETSYKPKVPMGWAELGPAEPSSWAKIFENKNYGLGQSEPIRSSAPNRQCKKYVFHQWLYQLLNDQSIEFLSQAE